MKQTFLFSLVGVVVISLWSCSGGDDAGTVKTSAINVDQMNFIDKAFAKDFELAKTTPQRKKLSAAWLDAWKSELSAVAKEIRKLYKNPEDQARLNAYLSSYDTVAERAFNLEILNWTDLGKDTRPVADNADAEAGIAEGYVYREATVNLLQHLGKIDKTKKYHFSYDGHGAGL